MVQNTSQNPLSSFLRNYGVTRIPKIVVVNLEQEEETISSSSSDYESSECSHTTAEDMIMATNQPEVKTEDSEVDPMDTATPSTATPPPTIGAKYNFTIDDIPMAKWDQRFQEFHSWMETQKLTRERFLTPSEWSQPYQWEYNSANKLAESSITIEDEYVQTIQSLKRMHIEKMDPRRKV
ncbi:hypothetical protein V6N11_011291 [Hibiscus sabdariffa]|uniref:Uncharacterized protein n=1 Tax=Hibiscus sabdariffa TaxID=183260 RepID=A0ABR2S8C1_9ROSI